MNILITIPVYKKPYYIWRNYKYINIKTITEEKLGTWNKNLLP
ncbi:MAG: hypothetical protein QXL18_03420 [Candidatus Woesearchaeota archaeon]